jgi:hypothetical protein
VAIEPAFFLRVLSFLPPKEIVIELAQIRMIREFTEPDFYLPGLGHLQIKRAWLVIEAGGMTYTLRPGNFDAVTLNLKGSSEATQVWLQAIESARGQLQRSSGV